MNLFNFHPLGKQNHFLCLLVVNIFFGLLVFIGHSLFSDELGRQGLDTKNREQCNTGDNIVPVWVEGTFLYLGHDTFSSLHLDNSFIQILQVPCGA